MKGFNNLRGGGGDDDMDQNGFVQHVLAETLNVGNNNNNNNIYSRKYYKHQAEWFIVPDA